MQSRPDRDDYVRIKWSNIKPGKEGNFEKCEECRTYDVGYDARSFMHYTSDSFAINKNKPTIESKVCMYVNNTLLIPFNLKQFHLLFRVVISELLSWELPLN